MPKLSNRVAWWGIGALLALVLAGVGLGVAYLAFGGWAKGQQWFVAPDGKPDNAGTLAAPWDIVTALSAPPAAIRPGDTIWLRGGVYEPDKAIQVKLQGKKRRPIVVRNWSGERATLRAMLDIGFSAEIPTRHVWFWGLEIQTRGTKAPGRGISMGNGKFKPATNPGIKIINCVIHDCPEDGIDSWGSSEEEVHGCIIYYNGYDGDPNAEYPRGFGQGLYIQSMTHKEFRNNIIFRQFFQGIQLYGGETAKFKNITLEGNTLFNNGEMSFCQGRKQEFPEIYVGSGTVENLRMVGNCVYTPGWALKGTVNVGCTLRAILADNYFVAPGPEVRVALDLRTLGGNGFLTMTNNTLIGMIVGFTPDQHGKGNVHLPQRPTSGEKIVIRRNGFEAGRANITIFNWDQSPSVEIDPGQTGLAPGEGYEVRDVQNWFGPPVAAGTADGKPIAIPMTGLSVAEPIALDGEQYKAPPHTGPEFGAFVILKTTEAPRGAKGVRQ